MLIKKQSVSRFLLIFILTLYLSILTSCISYDSEQEGIVGSVYDVQGIKVLVDSASDKMIAFALRNDTDHQVTVFIRPVGGEIGYRTSGSSGFAGVASNGQVRAAYITSPNDIILKSGEELMGKIFLKNWYLANKNFTSRFNFNVIFNDERHMVKIEADQDNIFTDAKDLFQQNKLGRNDPSKYGSRHYQVDVLPKDYTLSIPD